MELSIIFLPLIASIISGFIGKYIGDRNSEIVTSALVSISALFSIFLGDLAGQVFTLFILTVAAAEAAIGLAIIVVYFRNSGTIRVEEIDKLKG